jgi:hypothetical protein
MSGFGEIFWIIMMRSMFLTTSSGLVTVLRPESPGRA